MCKAIKQEEKTDKAGLSTVSECAGVIRADGGLIFTPSMPETKYVS